MTPIAVGTLALTRRKQLPFGQLRSEQSTAFGICGYVGGTNDPTGLTHLGAREYDPTLGRFLSVDPAIDINQPAQTNAYSYSHNNPLTLSDPDGLCPADLCGNGYPIGGTGQVKGGKTRHVKHASTGNRYKPGSYITRNGKSVVTFPGKKSAQQAKAQARARSAIAAAAAAKRKAAEADRRNKDGIFGNVMKGNWDAAWSQTKSGLHDTFGTWDGWKNRVLPAVGFGACLVVTAGLCTVGGALIVGATLIGDGLTTGSWNYATAGKSLAWTLAGGFAARGLAGSWKTSAILRRSRVETVHQTENVTIYGYRNVIDRGATYANVSLNAGLSTTFCGAGAASPGVVAGAC